MCVKERKRERERDCVDQSIRVWAVKNVCHSRVYKSLFMVSLIIRKCREKVLNIIART